MNALTLRGTAIALAVLIAIPAEAFALPQFQDVMKGYGPPVAAEPVLSIRPTVRRPSIRYKGHAAPRKAPERRAAKSAGKKAAAKARRASKAPARSAKVTPPPPKVAPMPDPVASVFDLDEFGGFNLPDGVLDLLPRAVVSGVVAAQAKAFLVKTVSIGGTMMTYGRRIAKERGLPPADAPRLGAEFAIGMLHDVFAIRLARAVKRARSDGLDVGVMSAYRDPTLHVGGYADKEKSNHAAGLAADIKGIATVAIAKKWQRIANDNGLYLPYGPNNSAERNHTQLLMTAATTPPLRKIIHAAARAKEPVQDRIALWKASGVKIEDVEPVRVEQLAYIGGGHRKYARNYARRYARHRHHRVHYARAA